MIILTAAQSTVDLPTLPYAYVTFSASSTDTFTVLIVNDDNTTTLAETDDARAVAIDATRRSVTVFGGPIYRVTRVEATPGASSVHASMLPR